MWQRPDRTQWRFDAISLAVPLAQVHSVQGYLACRLAELGLAQRDQATQQALTIVDMVLDATQQYTQPFTAERLFGWHAALPVSYWLQRPRAHSSQPG